MRFFGHQSFLGLSLLLGASMPASIACSGSRDIRNKQDDVVISNAALVTVDASVQLQTLEGFGASIAWYANLFTDHPHRDALAQLLFHDLGLDIIRMRNQHRTAGDSPDPDGVKIYQAAEASLGHPPRVLLTSWSPPAALKASNKTDCNDKDTDQTCSLRINSDGSYPYEEFADYWLESIQTYHTLGIDPYYVSIQNEPDYRPTNWEGCMFNDTERAGLPGYDQALAAVTRRFREANVGTRLLAGDTAHLRNGAPIRYAAAPDATAIYGVAHHLYDGNDWMMPDKFASAMADVATAFPNLPKFQTEFSPTQDGKAVEGGFEVAWLIHNAVAYEGAAAYLHWELIWPSSGLIAVEWSKDPSKWTTSDGYTIRPPYYSMRHFARYTDPGDHVVQTTSDASKLLSTAYLSPDGTRLTVVLLNAATSLKDVTLDLQGFPFAASLTFLTTSEAAWQPGDPLDPSVVNHVQLPARGIMTVVLSTGETPPN
jgi:glucuronoarabinoxylan endo-1,4-beta-xylanase